MNKLVQHTKSFYNIRTVEVQATSRPMSQDVENGCESLINSMYTELFNRHLRSCLKATLQLGQFCDYLYEKNY